MLVPLCFAQSNVGTKHALLLFSPVLFSFYILQLVCPLTYRLRFDEGIRALELDLDLRNGGRYVIGRIPLVRADALHDILECFLEHGRRLLQTLFGDICPFPTQRFSDLQLLLLLPARWRTKREA